MSVMNPGDIEVAKINIDKLKAKKYKSGQDAKQCKITYGIDRKPLIIRTPLATVPYGLSDGTFVGKDKETNEKEPQSKFKKYSFEIIIVGSSELDTFRNKLNEVDHKNVEFIQSQSNEWWKKSMTYENVKDFSYTSPLVKHKDDYPDRFKVKLPFFNGIPQFKVYNENKTPVNWVKQVKDGEPPELDWSWAQPNMRIRTIVEAECIWEVNKKTYCTFKASQICVYPTDGPKECDFDDEPVKVPSVVSVSAVSAETETEQDPVKVEDDEEDEEDEEDDN